MNYHLSIQWHITTECQNRCEHCHVFDPATYDHERRRRLSLKEKLQVMDQFDAFGEKWGFSFSSAAYMGGGPFAPLLRTSVRPGRSGGAYPHGNSPAQEAGPIRPKRDTEERPVLAPVSGAKPFKSRRTFSAAQTVK